MSNYAIDRISSYMSNSFTLEGLTNMYSMKFINEFLQIFEYKGLPKTIPKRNLELILLKGYGCTTRVNGELYTFYAGLGGEPNEYLEPTTMIVANPYLKFNKTLTIGVDCVWCKNDSLYQGILPLIKWNSYLLAQIDLSIKFASTNMRLPTLVTAPNDSIKESLELLYQQIEEGKKLGITIDPTIINSIHSYDYAKGTEGFVKNLIELKQYVIGTFYLSMGVQANYNMKREAINSGEANLSEDQLFPFIDDMFEQRKLFVKQINEMYGTNISVRKNSVWKSNEEEAKLTLEGIESQVESTETTPDDSPTEEVKEGEPNED